MTSRFLEAHGSCPASLGRVRAFLTVALADDENTDLDRSLVAGALGLPARPLSDEEALPGFAHHSAARKRVLVDTVMYLCGARTTLPHRTDEAFEATGLQSWKRSEMTACKVIHATAWGRPDLVLHRDLEIVSSPLRGPVIHEGNHLSHLLYLFALRPYPGYHDLVATGIERLLATQNPDGGFSLAADLDTWVTSVAGVALAEAGGNREVLLRMGDWIAANQRPDGGWAYALGVQQTDTDCAYTCLSLLRLLDDPDRYGFAEWRGQEYVRRMGNADGGWAVYRQGNPSEAAMTGGALVVLADRAAANRPYLAAGVAWLVDAQHSDGTFERNWSLAEGNAIFRAVHGLTATLDAGVLPADLARAASGALQRSARYLTSTQNPDGGWGHRAGRSSDPISTGFGLLALGRLGVREPVPAALRFLQLCRQPDGNIPSRPDTVSPRPIAIDLPDLSSAYVLRGLAQCAPAANVVGASFDRSQPWPGPPVPLAPDSERPDVIGDLAFFGCGDQSPLPTSTRIPVPDGGRLELPSDSGWRPRRRPWFPSGATGLGSSAARLGDGSAGAPRPKAVEIPAFYCPIPPKIHPDVVGIEKRTVAWMERFRLGHGEQHRRRMEKARTGYCAAVLTPNARAELTQVLADFITWILCFDDEYCDEGPLGGRPGELVEVMSRLHRVAEITEYPLDEHDRYGMALRDLRLRLDELATPVAAGHFIRMMNSYLLAEARRAGFVARSQRPGLNDYITIRLYSGAVMVLVDLMAPVVEIDLPPSIAERRAIRALGELAGVVSTLYTDICSYPKERDRTGDGFNIVDAIRLEKGSSEQEAVDEAVRMTERMLQLFLRMRDHLAKESDPALAAYLAALDHFVRGGLDWALETSRYRYLDGEGGTAAYRSGGITETPSQDSLEPLAIPSIAWWWDYDPAGASKPG